MKRSVGMIYAWIQAMEDAQPQYGPLLQSTVDKVDYPCIDQDGVIRTISEGLTYAAASGFMQGCASSHVENMKNHLLAHEYTKLKAAKDEEGMAVALAKWNFYKTLHQWIQSNDPQKLPMNETPGWLSPFMNSDA